MTIRAVHHLNCATLCPLAGFLLGGTGWRGRMVAHCLLVETERDGLVLVDTGFGTRDIAGQSGLTRSFRAFAGPALAHGETAIAQVEALGYAPTDVRHIVITHLDLDHAGGLADFPHAKVHVHAREHAAARQRGLVARWQWLRPRAVACAVAGLGMRAMIAAADYLTHMHENATRTTRIVHVDITPR